MLADDARYQDFRALRERHVVYCNLKASAFRELSPMHPDLLLADLINVFHPELSDSSYRPTFYHLLTK